MNLLILTVSVGNKNYEKIFDAIEKLEHNLAGILTLNEKETFTAIENYTVYPAGYIYVLKCDFVLIDCHIGEVGSFIPILEKLGIPMQKVRTVYWLLQQVMIKKYEDFDDKVIQETLEFWKTHELSVFNQHTEGYAPTLDEVFIDETCGLPYINFKTVEDKNRRMYFPRNGRSQIQAPDGKRYVQGVLREQVPTSPHLYIKGDHKVNEGDVLVDAGVCEGNFALRYVDICSKVYLFEMDKVWFEPLYYSFRDCWDKVELITKAVSDGKRGGVATSLDEAVDVPKNSKIFLKMDIEGYEPNALHGARKILSTNSVKASVCSYHNSEDALKIKSIFQKYGYKTAASDGYMVFIHDPKIWDTADFRKGIIYASNY